MEGRTNTQSTARSDGVPSVLSGPAHTLDIKNVLKGFGTDPKLGLSDSTVEQNKQTYGLNRLKETPPPSFWGILLRNLLNAMTMVLIAAAAVSKWRTLCLNVGTNYRMLTAAVLGFGTQDYISGGVIAALVFLNVGVGTINEYKAEKVRDHDLTRAARSDCLVHAILGGCRA